MAYSRQTETKNMVESAFGRFICHVFFSRLGVAAGSLKTLSESHFLPITAKIFSRQPRFRVALSRRRVLCPAERRTIGARLGSPAISG